MELSDVKLAAEVLPYVVSCCAVSVGYKAAKGLLNQVRRLDDVEKRIDTVEHKVEQTHKKIGYLFSDRKSLKDKIDRTGDSMRNSSLNMMKKFTHYDKMIATSTNIATSSSDLSKDRLRDMDKRIARMDATMKEIVARQRSQREYPVPSTPAPSSTILSEQNSEEESVEIVEVEEEVSERSCLSGATGLQESFPPPLNFENPSPAQNWVQSLPMIPAVSAGISVTPLKPVTHIPSRPNWSFIDPLSTPIKAIASFFTASPQSTKPQDPPATKES